MFDGTAGPIFRPSARLRCELDATLPADLDAEHREIAHAELLRLRASIDSWLTLAATSHVSPLTCDEGKETGE